MFAKSDTLGMGGSPDAERSVRMSLGLFSGDLDERLIYISSYLSGI